NVATFQRLFNRVASSLGWRDAIIQSLPRNHALVPEELAGALRRGSNGTVGGHARRQSVVVETPQLHSKSRTSGTSSRRRIRCWHIERQRSLASRIPTCTERLGLIHGGRCHV